MRHTSIAAHRLTPPVRFVVLPLLMLLQPQLEVPAAAGGGSHVAGGVIGQAGDLAPSAQHHSC